MKVFYLSLILALFTLTGFANPTLLPSASVANFSQVTDYSKLNGAASHVNGNSDGFRSTIGQLLVVDITPKPTNDFSDYTSAGGVYIAEDGFYIGIGRGCEISQTKILKISTLSDNSNYARVLIWYPGLATPELNDDRCQLGQFAETADLIIKKGAGASSGWGSTNFLYVDIGLSTFGERFPSEYLTGNVYQGNYISSGYHYNNTTHVYTSLATCFNSPSQCPRKTGNAYNTLIFYYSGAGQLTSAADFSSYWIIEALPIASGTSSVLVPSYFGPQAYNYEQGNFSLNANVTPNQVYNTKLTTYLGINNNLETGLWKVGNDN